MSDYLNELEEKYKAAKSWNAWIESEYTRVSQESNESRQVAKDLLNIIIGLDFDISELSDFQSAKCRWMEAGINVEWLINE